MNIFDKIQAGVDEYEKAVRAMSNAELWQHCFDDESLPEDFCRQEWDRREIDCICPAEITTGWTENDEKIPCCNICGKPVQK